MVERRKTSGGRANPVPTCRMSFPSKMPRCRLFSCILSSKLLVPVKKTLSDSQYGIPVLGGQASFLCRRAAVMKLPSALDPLFLARAAKSPGRIQTGQSRRPAPRNYLHLLQRETSAPDHRGTQVCLLNKDCPLRPCWRGCSPTCTGVPTRTSFCSSCLSFLTNLRFEVSFFKP